MKRRAVQKGETGLIAAARLGFHENVHLFLEHDAVVNAFDDVSIDFGPYKTMITMLPNARPISQLILSNSTI